LSILAGLTKLKGNEEKWQIKTDNIFTTTRTWAGLFALALSNRQGLTKLKGKNDFPAIWLINYLIFI
jgi:hypothetical protein